MAVNLIVTFNKFNYFLLVGCHSWACDDLQNVRAPCGAIVPCWAKVASKVREENINIF